MIFSINKNKTIEVTNFSKIKTFYRYGHSLQKLSSLRKVGRKFLLEYKSIAERISPLRGKGDWFYGICFQDCRMSPLRGSGGEIREVFNLRIFCKSTPQPPQGGHSALVKTKNNKTLKGEMRFVQQKNYSPKGDCFSLFQLLRENSNLSGFLFFIIFLLCSCQNDGKKNIKNFYYPIDEWKDGMVYEYQPVNDKSLPSEYWYFRKLETDTATYLAGQYYDNNFTVRQFFSAELVSNGVLMNEYSLMEYDSLGKMTRRPAEILAANSFPFEVKDSTGLFLFKLKWKNTTVPDAYLEMVRNRRYLGETKYDFKGKPQDCVVFKVKELVDDYNNGHLEQTYDGKEIYAKYLGLIYYKKEIGENFVLEYELKDTFSMAKLEAKFKNYLSE